MTQARSDPWWSSGHSADQGLDDQDPLAAHQRARRGAGAEDPAGDGAGDGGGDGGGDGEPERGWVDDVADVLSRFVADPGRRRSPHPDGEVCQACPICLGLRALRQARPEVIGHLADAAQAFSLALRALADGAGDDGTQDFQRIDLDGE